MIDRVEKQRVMDLLRRAGLWAEASRHREEVRQRLREDGKGKQEAVAAAWREMANKYLPLAEQATPAFQTILPDGAERFDDFVDTAYNETDDAAQMRDVYRWIKEEFHRIVVDHSAGTVVDYRLLQTPPPTGLACNILETWAARAPARRDGLYREIRVWLASAVVTSLADSEPETFLDEGKGGFLDEIS